MPNGVVAVQQWARVQQELLLSHLKRTSAQLDNKACDGIDAVKQHMKEQHA